MGLGGRRGPGELGGEGPAGRRPFARNRGSRGLGGLSPDTYVTRVPAGSALSCAMTKRSITLSRLEADATRGASTDTIGLAETSLRGAPSGAVSHTIGLEETQPAWVLRVAPFATQGGWKRPACLGYLSREPSLADIP